MVNEGDKRMVETHTYVGPPPPRWAFRPRFGPSDDEDGLAPDALPELMRDGSRRVFYTSPHSESDGRSWAHDAAWHREEAARLKLLVVDTNRTVCSITAAEIPDAASMDRGRS